MHLIDVLLEVALVGETLVAMRTCEAFDREIAGASVISIGACRPFQISLSSGTAFVLASLPFPAEFEHQLKNSKWFQEIWIP